MSNCNLLRLNLFAYTEKALPIKTVLQLDSHIESCPECARLVAEFVALDRVIENQKTIEPLPFATTRIMLGIESRLKKRTAAAHSFRPARPALAGIGVVAALAFGFLIGTQAAKSHTSNQQNVNQVETVRTELNIPDFMNDSPINFTEQNQ